MRRKILYFCFIILVLSSVQLAAQVQGLEEGSQDARIIDRLITTQGLHHNIATGLQPYGREEVTALAVPLDSIIAGLSIQDRHDLYRIYKNNNEWLVQPGAWEGFSKIRQPITFRDYQQNLVTLTSHVDASSQHARYILRDRPVLKWFFLTPGHLFEAHSNHFYIKVNPLLSLHIARDYSDGTFFIHQQGIRLRGGVDERIYFSADILNSQARFPEYVRDFTHYHQAIPGNGWYKTKDNKLFNIRETNDFLNANGYIGFRIIPHITAQFGYGRHFIGHGYRSLLLSDFSNNYLYLKFLTRVGRFTYQNLFAELSAFSPNAQTDFEGVPKKYMASHYLGFQVLPNLNIGLFESVIFSRSDQFEFQYLNPVILYRSVQQMRSSRDNILVGLNMDWRFLRQFQCYGQYLFNDLKISEWVRPKRGWWGNQHGFQLGLKAFNVAGVDHLDLQIEYNQVRPYTYQHVDSLANYTHSNLALAHPLGANFREIVFAGRYQPHKSWVVEGRYIHALAGWDPSRLSPGDVSNFGGDLLRSSQQRPGDYGHTTGQGKKVATHLAGIDVHYELFHHCWLQVSWFRRRQTTDLDNRLVHYIGGGIRWNIAERRMDF